MLALIAAFPHDLEWYFCFVVHHFPAFRRPFSIAWNALSAMTTRRPARMVVAIFP
jgi:hypothetical protein